MDKKKEPELIDVCGVEMTEQTAKDLRAYLLEPAFGPFWKIVKQQEQYATARAMTIERPTYTVCDKPKQEQVVPYEYARDERMMNVGQAAAFTLLQSLAHVIAEVLGEE